MMKLLRRNLLAVSKNLKMLVQKTEQMINTLDKLDKPEPKTKSSKSKAVKKVAIKKISSQSATEDILTIIKRSKKAVNTATLQKKTGYHNRKIWDIVHRAYKEGKIKKVGRGLYTKV